VYDCNFIYYPVTTTMFQALLWSSSGRCETSIQFFQFRWLSRNCVLTDSSTYISLWQILNGYCTELL